MYFLQRNNPVGEAAESPGKVGKCYNVFVAEVGNRGAVFGNRGAVCVNGRLERVIADRSNFQRLQPSPIAENILVVIVHLRLERAVVA